MWVVLHGFISQGKTVHIDIYIYILAWLLSLSLYSSVLCLSRPVRQQGRNRVSTRSLGLTTHMKVRGPSMAGLPGLMWPPRSPLSLVLFFWSYLCLMLRNKDFFSYPHAHTHTRALWPHQHILLYCYTHTSSFPHMLLHTYMYTHTDEMGCPSSASGSHAPGGLDFDRVRGCCRDECCYRKHATPLTRAWWPCGMCDAHVAGSTGGGNGTYAVPSAVLSWVKRGGGDLVYLRGGGPVCA